MSDIYSDDKRKEIMKKVRNKNTAPEQFVSKLLCELGYKNYRRKTVKLECKPDFIFVGLKKAIFVNGCFWHGHSCNKGHLPEKNYDFWKTKIEINKERDEKNYTELTQKKWSYLVIWQCELKKKEVENLRKRINAFMQ
ncbi:Very short patch repair protein [Eubacterium plexicaudatum ASF492]|uniref:DNA mismatch endonuclease Vsr n=1 Tax=Eubacterium plexicaudatum ASF492 TaxID=1235802 RepID=N2A107_9FIRM|nr:Very short patch repair protein [Eubacterium plexicaudatum ASF492]